MMQVQRWGPIGRRTFLVGSLASLGAACSGSSSKGSTADSTSTPPGPTTTAKRVTIVDAQPTFITPNAEFFRIDNSFGSPKVDPAAWKMTIGGMVDKPITLDLATLSSMPQVTRTITLCCVSNEVGGDLVGNAEWTGVLLAPLLKECGIKTGAEQVFSTSVDDWTCGFPVSAALDGRDAMIALRMNGEPLPVDHGFPARLVVPGLYGYVCNTKWLKSIELTTWDAKQGYWIPLGWSRDAPVKTQSRIDVPRRGAQIPSGTFNVAGVAWAQHRGIAKVEVRVDDGPWSEATLGADDIDDAWRLWSWNWDATPGNHRITVRATDGSGAVQDATVRPPEPDGATGYHTRTVTVA